MDGKNIADYVDPDILLKLDELEREEEMLEKARLEKGDMSEESEEDLPEEFYDAHKIV
jgi:nucleolar GTP-binding protein